MPCRDFVSQEIVSCETKSLRRGTHCPVDNGFAPTETVKFPTAGMSGILKQKAYFEYAPALQHQKKNGMMKKN